MDIYDLLSEIEYNNKEERKAIEGYYELIGKAVGIVEEYVFDDNSDFAEKLDAFIEDIKEIISDEMNHSEKLAKWSSIFSFIEPNED